MQNLGEFGRTLKQVLALGHLSLLCMMCSRLVAPKSPRFDRACEIPVNVFYFFNVNKIEYTDETLTHGFGSLGIQVIILLYAVFSNELILSLIHI